MTSVLVLALLLLLTTSLGFAFGWLAGRRSLALDEDRLRADLATTVDLALDAVRHERSETMRAALDTVLTVASSKLGDQLEAGRAVIDQERHLVARQVEGVHHELARVASLVNDLQKEGAAQTGQIASGLEQAFRVTANLADSTRSLERALASPKARGQWGERMAEDVLRAAGFAEGINYTKQTKLASGRIPDYTFPLPRGHVVHMDVKFPLDNYLRWLEADEGARPVLARQFQRDVRQRIKEIGDRCYVDPETTVDYVLLFVPNESVYGFLHEHDGSVIDLAIASKVVLCSPTTLFAVLAVVRQAVDNFLVERRSDEILGALAALREQWQRWVEPIDKMRRGLTSAQKAFDELAGPRTRQFERQLDKLEALRDSRPSELAASAATDPAPAGDGSAVDDTDEVEPGRSEVRSPRSLRQVV
ncbi:MAG: DNA recombination protein RmuC [Acidimicrobiales bacterium]